MTTEKIRLLYPFANVMGIFFPVGKLENSGTCEFATERCLKECIAFKNMDNENIIPFEQKSEVYKYFINVNNQLIIRKILIELEMADCNIITWFASGDCPLFLTDKIFNIIKSLFKLSVVQSGFTRNISLYNLLYRKEEILYGGDLYKFPDNLRIVLTLENKEQIKKVGGNVQSDSILIAIPNYESKKTEIFTHQFDFDPQYCCYSYNPITKHINDENYDCKKCYKKKEGCFIKF